MPCRPSAPPVSQDSLVGDLAEHQRDAERHHQPGQVGAAQDEEARDEAEERRGDRRRDASPTSGSPITVLRQEPGHVGAEPEEGGVAERHDAGIAEDEVEGEREETDDRDLVEDEMALGQEEQGRGGHEPEDDLAQAPAPPAAQGRPDSFGSGRLHRMVSYRVSAPGRKGPAGEGRGRRSSACR